MNFVVSQYSGVDIIARYCIAKTYRTNQNCLGFAFYAVGITTREEMILLGSVSNFFDRIEVAENLDEALLVGAVLRDLRTDHLSHMAVLDPRDERRSRVLQRTHHHGGVTEMSVDEAFSFYLRTGNRIEYFTKK